MEIEEKYNIIYKGKERFYKYHLSDNRRSDMENTRPEAYCILGEEILNTTWVRTISDISKLLLENGKCSREDLLNFSVDWYDRTIFTDTKLTNFTEVEEGLFVNTNLASVRSYWLICDLVNYAGIDTNEAYIIVKRFGVSEPKEVKEYYINQNLNIYKEYLETKYNNDSRLVERDIKLIKTIDSKCKDIIDTSYSLFLIDDKNKLYGKKIEILKYFEKNLRDKSQFVHVQRVMEDYYELMKKRWKI